jgi:HTH-type transcriptional regulator / antitoxin HigA
MMDQISPIRTDADHRAAVLEIERLWDAKEGTAEFDRLDVLATLVDAYEAKRWCVEALDPVETIRADMDLNGRTQSDLAALIGKNRASEVLRRSRPLTLTMIRKLHAAWRIPADQLVSDYQLSPHSR